MKAHRTDLVSFSFGLVFLALSVWWLLARILGLAIPPVGWFLAGALIVVGVLGLVGALRSGRHAPAPPEAGATVSAPYEGGPGWAPPAAAPEADEWRIDAVADEPVGAVADRPVRGGTGEPRWSPAAPPTDPGPPTTGPDAWEQPEGAPPTREQTTVDAAPPTREQPTVDVTPPTREQTTVDLGPTGAGRSGVGDAAATREQRAAGDGPAAGPDGEKRSPA